MDNFSTKLFFLLLIGSDIKPSVSITPVSSADAATLNMKKPAGIEIIPLGDKLPENETGNSNRKTEKSSSSSSSSDSKSSSLLKEIKRSLSEDDKRRMEKKEGKKRKRDHFVLSKDQSPSSSSSNSNRSVNHFVQNFTTRGQSHKGQLNLCFFYPKWRYFKLKYINSNTS